jgi:uncharacterized protein YkwD
MDLLPIPGRVAPDAEIVVKGTLPAEHRSPRLYVRRPDGSVEQRDLAREAPQAAMAENEVSVRIKLEERGEHDVELIAEGPGGPKVVALRRVFVGVDPPSAPPPEPPPPAERGLDTVTASISALRAARGLAPLVRDAALDAVAEGHSKEMARTRVFAHVLEGDGKLSDRLARAGYAYRSAAENIGFADSPAMAHDAIETSPAHLANLLDPRYRRVGLGAVKGLSPDGEDNSGVYLTEVFALPIVGFADPAGEVMSLFTSERRKRALRPLLRDRRLDAFAEREVRRAALASGPPNMSGVRDRWRKAAPDLHDAIAKLHIGTEPESTFASEELAESSWTRVGIGALYANSQTQGPGRLWVLAVFAR